MGKMSESDFGFDRVRKFGFENSNSKIRNLSPQKGTTGSTICQLNTSGSKIPHLRPYKGAFLLRRFAHTKGKNLINRVDRVTVIKQFLNRACKLVFVAKKMFTMEVLSVIIYLTCKATI